MIIGVRSKSELLCSYDTDVVAFDVIRRICYLILVLELLFFL